MVPAISGCLSLFVLVIAFGAGAAAARDFGWAPVIFGLMALVPLTLCWSAYRIWSVGPRISTLSCMAVASLLLFLPASILEWEVVRMGQPHPGVLALTSAWWASAALSGIVTLRLWFRLARDQREGTKLKRVPSRGSHAARAVEQSVEADEGS